MKKVPPKFVEFSRKLRREQTPWESKIWQYLRNRNYFGAKFKRQVRFGNHIVDFCCAEKKLVVELDGGQHGMTANQRQDANKEKYLQSEGLRILRFWNNDIDHNLEGVLDTIRDYLE